MQTSTKGMIGVVLAVLFMAAAAYAFFGKTPDPPARGIAQVAGGAGAQCCNGDPAAKLRMTLDPNLFAGEVKKAYQVAGDDPALLAQMHCYCGCDRIEGHKNLLDCFRDKHGSTCAICTGEAIEAEKLAGEGMPVEQIRDSLRARYAGKD
ncbi:MAG TPA: CYCXC family (seleno)protein [Candidatus Binataceae bacterium]|nr:CYCXC family (seleno)protein [Candidatus Binataceae bacterium]